MTPIPSTPKQHAVFGLCLLVTLLVSAWVRFHVLEIYDDNRSLLEVSSRTQSAMAEARKILRGQGTGGLFGSGNASGYNADDTGFALYIAGVWAIASTQDLRSLQAATVYLDLLALTFLILALSRVFNRISAILTGLLYALYLPIPIQIAYANNHVLVVQFAVLLISLILFIPRHPVGQIVWTLFTAGLFIFANTVRSVFGPFAFLIGFFLFLKYGKKRGLLIGLLFVTSVIIGNLCLKVVMGNPSHQVWHSLYVGLGEFPNPYGLTGLDTEGNEEAGRVHPGVDMYRTTHEYMEVIKHRALVLIDEDRGFYLKALLQRAFKVLIGFQDWYFIGVGLEGQTARTISWVLFFLGWGGMGFSFFKRRWDAFLLFMAYLYLSLCIVPLLATHPSYYIGGSVMLLPFVGYLLASIRISGLNTEDDPGTKPWETDLSVSRWVVGFVAIGLVTTIMGTTLFLAYAHHDATQWKEDFLGRIVEYPPLRAWKPEDIQEPTLERNASILSATLEETTLPRLFHLSVQVDRGRLGIELRDSQNHPLTPPLYTAGVGLNHCFLGCPPQAVGAVHLHVWEAEPRKYPDHYDRNEGPYFEETFRHFEVVDYAKFEFYPNNRLEVSASFFPNGHETIPFRMNKERPSTNPASKIPNYWAAGAPCWTQMSFESPRKINRVVCQVPNQRVAINPPYLQIRTKNQKAFRAPMTLERDVLHEGREVRFQFNEIEVTGVQIKFDQAGNDMGIAYLQDVSIPQPAEFEINEIALYEGSDQAEFPVALSFISNDRD